MALSKFCYDHCNVPLPVPAGKSPFRIRGEFYRHLDKTITHVDGKSGGALLKLFDERGLTAFQRQPFVSTALYDNLPLPRMVMGIAEVMGRDVVELTAKMGRQAAESQLKGKYKDLVVELNLRTFDVAFEKLLGFFYDHGQLTVTRGADGRSMRVERGGLPLGLIEWWTVVSVPFVTHALELNGGKASIKSRIVVTDADAKIPLGSAVWDVVVDR